MATAPESRPPAAPASARRVGARLRSAARVATKPGIDSIEIANGQTFQVWPSTIARRSPAGVSASMTRVAIHTTATGEATSRPAPPARAPGRASLSAPRSAPIAIASGRATLAQNSGVCATVARSWRRPSTASISSSAPPAPIATAVAKRLAGRCGSTGVTPVASMEISSSVFIVFRVSSRPVPSGRDALQS